MGEAQEMFHQYCTQLAVSVPYVYFTIVMELKSSMDNDEELASERESERNLCDTEAVRKRQTSTNPIPIMFAFLYFVYIFLPDRANVCRCEAN
jgi:hypothetical protein